MAWPPVYTPPVPQVVDQGYPPEWGPQPMSVDATLPTPTPVDAWPPQFPEQALSDATAAPLAANPPMGATTAAPPPSGQPSPAEQAVEPPAPLSPKHGAPDAPYPPQASDNQPDVVSGGGIEHANKNGGNFAQPNSPYEEALARKYGIQSQAEQAQAQGDQRNVDEYARNLAINQLKDARDNELKAQALAKVQAASAKVDAMQVDPNHWWASRSGPQKVGSLIGAAIGGFLAARQQTGHNAFLDGINQAIQEDINVQMANIDNAKAGVNRQQSLYANYLEQLGDAKAARYATAGKMFELGAMRTAAEVSKFKSPMTRADGELARQQLLQASQANYAAAQQEAFKNQLAFDEQARKDAETRSVIAKNNAEAARARGGNPKEHEHEALKVVPNLLVPDVDERGRPIMQYQEVQGPDGAPLKPTVEIDARSGKPIVDPKTGKPMYKEVLADKSGETSVEQVQVGKDANGKPVYEDRVVKATPKRSMHKARSPEESGEIADTIAGYREYEDAMNDLDAARVRYGSEWFKSSEGSQIYRLARERAIFALQHIHGVKRMTDTDLKKFDADIPDPSHITNVDDGKKAIENMRMFGRRAIRTRLDKYGVPRSAVMQGDEPQIEEPPVDLAQPENWSHPPDPELHPESGIEGIGL